MSQMLCVAQGRELRSSEPPSTPITSPSSPKTLEAAWCGYSLPRIILMGRKTELRPLWSGMLLVPTVFPGDRSDVWSHSSQESPLVARIFQRWTRWAPEVLSNLKHYVIMKSSGVTSQGHQPAPSALVGACHQVPLLKCSLPDPFPPKESLSCSGSSLWS